MTRTASGDQPDRFTIYHAIYCTYGTTNKNSNSNQPLQLEDLQHHSVNTNYAKNVPPSHTCFRLVTNDMPLSVIAIDNNITQIANNS
jgi:hypothetical protein